MPPLPFLKSATVAKRNNYNCRAKRDSGIIRSISYLQRQSSTMVMSKGSRPTWSESWLLLAE